MVETEREKGVICCTRNNGSRGGELPLTRKTLCIGYQQNTSTDLTFTLLGFLKTRIRPVLFRILQDDTDLSERQSKGLRRENRDGRQWKDL